MLVHATSIEWRGCTGNLSKELCRSTVQVIAHVEDACKAGISIGSTFLGGGQLMSSLMSCVALKPIDCPWKYESYEGHDVLQQF